MKKQILFLAFFVLALLAGTSKSYGQCGDDPQHPLANKAYQYQATNTPGTSPVYNWYVTLDTDIKNGIKETSGGGLFTMTAGNTANASITWTAAAIEYSRTNPIFVALWYSETSTSTTNCTVENVRAIQIKPVNSFLLAITGVDGSGATSTTVCAAPVLTAVVDNPAAVSATPESATMAITYGANTITYKITASGVEGTWSPRIQIPALTGAQTYASIEWSTSPNSGFAAFSPAATGAGTYTATATDVPVSVAGIPYYVRLVINQNSYESLADQTLNVAVDGYLANNHTVSDIDDAGACAEATPFFRNANVTILPRPNLVPGNPAFMLKTP